MIPRILHQGWFGPKPAPMKLINQWKSMYEAAGWEHYLWTDHDLHVHVFNALREKMEDIKHKPYMEWNGICDLARWQAVLKLGGWWVDADAIPLAVFPDEWNEHKAVAFWENEVVRPGLVAAGYFGCEPGSPLVADIIKRIQATDVKDPAKMAWETVGPVPLTHESFRHPELIVKDARHVIPRHFTGTMAPGDAKIYADQLFLSTHHGGYEKYQ